MNTTIKQFLVFILALLALSGCFGFLKRGEQKPAAPETAENGQLVTTEPDENQAQPELPSPPSFQDGDLYLQALAAKDTALCAKIGNESLKARCEQNAAGQ